MMRSTPLARCTPARRRAARRVVAWCAAFMLIMNGALAAIPCAMDAMAPAGTSAVTPAPAPLAHTGHAMASHALQPQSARPPHAMDGPQDEHCPKCPPQLLVAADADCDHGDAPVLPRFADDQPLPFLAMPSLAPGFERSIITPSPSAYRLPPRAGPRLHLVLTRFTE